MYTLKHKYAGTQNNKYIKGALQLLSNRSK